MEHGDVGCVCAVHVEDLMVTSGTDVLASAWIASRRDCAKLEWKTVRGVC